MAFTVAFVFTAAAHAADAPSLGQVLTTEPEETTAQIRSLFAAHDSITVGICEVTSTQTCRERVLKIKNIDPQDQVETRTQKNDTEYWSLEKLAAASAQLGQQILADAKAVDEITDRTMQGLRDEKNAPAKMSGAIIDAVNEMADEVEIAVDAKWIAPIQAMKFQSAADLDRARPVVHDIIAAMVKAANHAILDKNLNW